MCARRFLILVFILTLLFVAGAFAIFQFGGDVLLKQAVPKGHFEQADAGDAPDYSKQESWIARPDLPDDPARWTPDIASAAAAAEMRPAVFYIHPTTYLQRDRWNAPLLPGGDTEFRTRLFVQSQASAFNGVGEIWAPRYRQAAFGAFLLNNQDAQKALDLAFADVQRAFGEFLSNVRYDRPIILAAHSQGALLLLRLLRRQDYGLQGRTIAAYVVGWPISTSADLPSLALPACRSSDQTGCLLSWLSFGEPANPELVLQSYEGSAGLAGGKRKREDVLCVNPITGTQNGAAPPQANPGTLVPTTDLGSATLIAGRVGARCDKGLLIVNGNIPPLGPYVLPGNNYHVYDYALFWGAIRRDAQRRVAAWNQ